MAIHLLDNPTRLVTTTEEEASAFVAVKGRLFKGFIEVSTDPSLTELTNFHGQLAIVFTETDLAQKLLDAMNRQLNIGPKDVPPLKD